MMHRARLIRLLGIFLAGGLALSIGNRPSVKAGLAPTQVAIASVGGAFGGGGAGAGGEEPRMPASVAHIAAEPMSLEATKTWLKLQDKVAVRFPEATPLVDYKTFLETVTADKDNPSSGIAIYVDPQSLQDIGKTMSSATFSIDLKAVPLATSMELILAQLQLRYRVQKDGIVLITSDKSEEPFPADRDVLILDNLAALRAEVRALREELHLVRSSGLEGPGSGAQPQPPANGKPMGGMGGGFR